MIQGVIYCTPETARAQTPELHAQMQTLQSDRADAAPFLHLLIEHELNIDHWPYLTHFTNGGKR